MRNPDSNMLARASSAIIRHFEESIIESAKVTNAARMAPRIDWNPRGPDGKPLADENGVPVPLIPDGMTPEQVRIAGHAMESSKNAPIYLVHAMEMEKLAMKLMAQAGSGSRDPELAPQMVIVQPEPQYERVGATEKPEIGDERE